MKRWMQIALMLGAALAGGLLAYGIGNWRDSSKNGVVLAHGTLLAEPRPIPPFALTDATNRPFGNAELRSGWTLMFFGFTHCPDICPATLGTLAAARRLLADLPAPVQPRIALVSVDPVRDPPAVLRAYVSFFDPQLVGLTGSQDAVDSFTRQLGVAVLRGKPDATGSYEVSHTSSVFVIDPRGRLVAILGAPHTPAGIAADFRAIVAVRQS